MTAFSARYDLDRMNGIITRVGHPLRGESITGKILVCPSVQGGVAAGWAFLAMKGRGVGFAGLVFGLTNPVMVQGAVAAQLPILAGIDPGIFETLKTGQIIRVDPAALDVTILD
jgi:predicted aconitase with swiveling domain